MTRERHLDRRPPQQVARLLALLDHRQILQAGGMYNNVSPLALACQPIMRDAGTGGDLVECLLCRRGFRIFLPDQLLDLSSFELDESIAPRAAQDRHFGEAAHAGEMRAEFLGELRGELHLILGSSSGTWTRIAR